MQLAKSMGAHVTGVCSTANVEMVRALGADVVVDYRKQSVEEACADGEKSRKRSLATLPPPLSLAPSPRASPFHSLFELSCSLRTEKSVARLRLPSACGISIPALALLGSTRSSTQSADPDGARARQRAQRARRRGDLGFRPPITSNGQGIGHASLEEEEAPPEDDCSAWVIY